MDETQLLQGCAAVATGCMAAKTRKAARALTAHYEAKLRPAELTVGQFTLLVAIRIFGTTTVAPLADAMGMDRTTLNRNLKPLQRDKLLDIARGPHDARTRTVTLTRSGKRRLARALPLWREAQREVEREFGSKLSRLRKDLDALVDFGG